MRNPAETHGLQQCIETVVVVVTLHSVTLDFAVCGECPESGFLFQVSCCPPSGVKQSTLLDSIDISKLRNPAEIITAAPASSTGRRA
jgi:hypothetical protein